MNVAGLPGAESVSEWALALEKYADALEAYTEGGARSLTQGRPALEEKLQAALQAVRDIGANSPTEAEPQPETQSSAQPEARLSDVYDRLEKFDEVRRRLDDAAESFLGDDLYREATSQRSKTFEEGVTRKRDRLRDMKSRAAEVAARELDTIVAAAIRGEFSAGADSVDDASTCEAVGPSATIVSAAVLSAQRASEVAQRADAAKDCALGGAPDSAARVAEATSARRDLHQMQRFTVGFGLVPAGDASAPDSSTLTLDLSLPQALTDVKYDLAPLISATAARAFGPPATTAHGLSYNLVRRLDTIRETPLGEAPRPAAAIPERIARVCLTTDRAKTFTELVSARGLALSSYETVGAGPKPRVALLGGLLNEAVFGDADTTGTTRTIPSRARTSEGSANVLVEAFEKQGASMSPTVSAEEIAQALVAKFPARLQARWDEGQIVDAVSFQAAALGDDRTPSEGAAIYRTWIAQVVTEIARRRSEREMLSAETTGASARLFGTAGHSATSGLRREMALTNYASLRSTVAAVRRKLAVAFRAVEGPARVARALADRDGSRVKVTGHGATVARRQLVGLFGDMVKVGLTPAGERGAGKSGGPVEKLDSVEPPPSLKKFAILKGVHS